MNENKFAAQVALTVLGLLSLYTMAYVIGRGFTNGTLKETMRNEKSS